MKDTLLANLFVSIVVASTFLAFVIVSIIIFCEKNFLFIKKAVLHRAKLTTNDKYCFGK